MVTVKKINITIDPGILKALDLSVLMDKHFARLFVSNEEDDRISVMRGIAEGNRSKTIELALYYFLVRHLDRYVADGGDTELSKVIRESLDHYLRSETFDPKKSKQKK